jgi:hypothetical protein
MSVIEIFRAGRQTAQNGAAVNVPEADLAASAEAYDPAVSEAPVVVGHPATDAPAYGWVKGLTARAGALFAELTQVDPAFAEIVRAGRYKKISASFYTPHSPENPKPGFWYLRHVGFLGAAAPAVKGLRPVAFAAAGEGVVEFTAQDAPWIRVAGLLGGLRSLLAEKFGQMAADTALPRDEVTALVTTPQPDAATAAQTPPPGDKAVGAPMEPDLIQREAALAAASASFNERVSLVESGAFVEGLLRDGRALPRDREFLISFLAGLPARGTVEFAEGGSMVKKTMTAAFKDFLGKLPAVVDFGERSAAAPAAEGPHAELGRKIAEAAVKRK